MTRVFVYEYCTATGLGRDQSDPAHSLFREGRAMRNAVAADFAAVPGVAMAESADEADWAVIIAPEFDGILAKTTGAIGCRLLGPSPDAVAVTSDKLALAHLWQANGVPTPRTVPIDLFDEVGFPCVFKPRDGAGSEDTFRCERTSVDRRIVHLRRDMIAQPFVPGRAASVAFLVGPRETVALPPTFQHLSDDGRFAYLGGELPIPPDLADRAVALGRQAIDSVPGLLGYVGVDLILGDAADGSADVAIEINPRLTTSYVGLRALTDENLAGAMLRVASCEPVGDIAWKPGPVRFSPDGTVRAG